MTNEWTKGNMALDFACVFSVCLCSVVQYFDFVSVIHCVSLRLHTTPNRSLYKLTTHHQPAWWPHDDDLYKHDDEGSIGSTNPIKTRGLDRDMHDDHYSLRRRPAYVRLIIHAPHASISNSPSLRSPSNIQSFVVVDLSLSSWSE